MTPNTTPAPMTHEGDDVFIPKSCCIRADGACFEEGECLSDCEALDRDLLRGASERELRQRLERAERDRNDWRTRADALAAEVEALKDDIRCAVENASIESGFHDRERRRADAAEARIAELEAVVGRLRAENEVSRRAHAALVDDGFYGPYALGADLWDEWSEALREALGDTAREDSNG